MSNILRAVLVCAVFFAVFWVSINYRTLGFAGLSAGMTFALSLVLDARRLYAETPFFLGPSARLPLLLALPNAFIGALLRAVAVGLAALFLFSINTEGSIYANAGDPALKSYISFASARDTATRYAIFGLIAVFFLIGVFLNHLTRGRTQRWSFFRMILVFSLSFAAVTLATERPSEAFDPKKLASDFKLINTAFSEVRKGANACVNLEDCEKRQELAEAELRRIAPKRNIVYQPTDKEYIKKEKEIASIEKTRRCFKKNKPNCIQKPADTRTAALLAAAILDEIVSEKTVAIFQAANIIEGRAGEFASAAIGVTFSTRIVQGIVIATYVTALLSLWNFGRRRNEA